MEYSLHDSSIVTIAMILQKSIMEQTDITELLRNLKFNVEDDKLVANNPPIIEFPAEMFGEMEEGMSDEEIAHHVANIKAGM